MSYFFGYLTFGNIVCLLKVEIEQLKTNEKHFYNESTLKLENIAVTDGGRTHENTNGCSESSDGMGEGLAQRKVIVNQSMPTLTTQRRYHVKIPAARKGARVMVVAREGNLKVIECLTRYGADVNSLITKVRHHLITQYVAQLGMMIRIGLPSMMRRQTR